MRIIKHWLNKNYRPGGTKYDIQENDLGQFRYKSKEVGSVEWSDWLSRDYPRWDTEFLKFVDTTPPDIDNSTPSEEQVKNENALKKWLDT